MVLLINMFEDEESETRSINDDIVQNSRYIACVPGHTDVEMHIGVNVVVPSTLSTYNVGSVFRSM